MAADAATSAMTAERDIWTEPSNEGIYDTLVDGVDVGFGIVLPHWAFNAILATFPIIALVHELGPGARRNQALDYPCERPFGTQHQRTRSFVF